MENFFLLVALSPLIVVGVAIFIGMRRIEKANDEWLGDVVARWMVRLVRKPPRDD